LYAELGFLTNLTLDDAHGSSAFGKTFSESDTMIWHPRVNYVGQHRSKIGANGWAAELLKQFCAIIISTDLHYFGSIRDSAEPSYLISKLVIP
jgi:hypothetical protein